MDIEPLHDDMFRFLSAFSTSMAIGLLIGLERERSPAAKAGLRTFTLVALFGTLAAFLSERSASPWFLVSGLAVVGLMMIAAYFREPDASGDPGTTTVAAVVVCYGLGAMIWHGQSVLAVMLAIVTTILLHFKAELRGITISLTHRDLTAILQFCVLSFIILPILPDRNYGPFNALNPAQIWWMVVLISGLSLAGYAALRIAGNRSGAPLVGIFGGLASSTATTLVFSRHYRGREDLAPVVIMVILLANLMVPVRLVVLGAFVAPGLLGELLPVVAGGLLGGILATLPWWRRVLRQSDLPEMAMGNPMELRIALGFGLFYALVLACSSWLTATVGSRGLFLAALFTGLADLDAIALTSMRLFNLQKLSANEVVAAITLALVANMVFKSAMVLFIAGRGVASRCAMGMGIMAVGLGGAFLLFSP